MWLRGCTNPFALNYNISATTDDGSCLLPPSNNSIFSAEPITCEQALSGSLLNATDEEGLVSGLGDNPIEVGGVWYVFNAEANYQVMMNTCNTYTSFLDDPVVNTNLHVFIENSDGELIQVINNDDNCGLMSNLSFEASAGEDYFVHVSRSSMDVAGNEFTLEISCGDFYDDEEIASTTSTVTAYAMSLNSLDAPLKWLAISIRLRPKTTALAISIARDAPMRLPVIMMPEQSKRTGRASTR